MRTARRFLILAVLALGAFGASSTPALAANNCSVTVYNVTLGPTVYAATAFNCSANADILQLGQVSPAWYGDIISEDGGVYNTYPAAGITYYGNPIWGNYWHAMPCPHPGQHTWTHYVANYRIHWSDAGGHWGGWQSTVDSWPVTGACA